MVVLFNSYPPNSTLRKSIYYIICQLTELRLPREFHFEFYPQRKNEVDCASQIYFADRNTPGPGAKQVPAPLRKTLGNFPPSPAPSAPPTQRAFESALDCGCAARGAPPLPGYRRPPPQRPGFCSHRGLRNLVSCAQNKAGGTA